MAQGILPYIEQEELRQPDRAFIPAPNEHLQGLVKINKDMTAFINLPGRIVKRSHSLIIRLTKNNPAMGLLINVRERIAMLQPVPTG